MILIKEKLNNILATLRYSSSYANVQNSYGRIFASLGINENKNSITDKVEEVTTEEISFNQKEKVIVEDIKEENKIVAKEEIKEFSENIETH